MAGKKRRQASKPTVDLTALAKDNPYIAGLLTMFLGESDVESFDDAAYRLNLKEGIERMVGKTHEADVRQRGWHDVLMQRAINHWDDLSVIKLNTAHWSSIVGMHTITRMLTHGEQATDKLFNLSEESALFAKGGGLDKVIEASAKRAGEIVMAALKEMGETVKAVVDRE